MSWLKRKPKDAGSETARRGEPTGASADPAGSDKGVSLFVKKLFSSTGKQKSQAIAAVEKVEGATTLDRSDNFFVHGEDVVAFGLNWQLLKDGQLQKVRAQALVDGYTHQVLSVESDLLGVLKVSEKRQESQPMYSAALLLSETVSLGGDEVFVFRLDGSRYAMVALKNSMPVPGFDLIGRASDIAAAAQNYLGLPHKNEVRQCGDAEILSGAEYFDFSVALSSLDRSIPRIKKIQDVRALIFRGALLAGLTLLLVVGWVGWSYFEAKAEAERLQRESDPNLLYERSFSTSAPSVKGLGTVGLRAMINTLTNIPLEVGGWGLTSATCQHTECIATWTRHVGNFADFDKNLPGDVKQSPEYGFIGTDNKGVLLKTRHEVKIPASDGLVRENLPLVAQVQADFVSRLQDYSLIEARVQVQAPAPFPSGVSDIGPIFKPVLAGTWSMELPLWTMDSMAVPDYVLVESLSLEMPSQVDNGKTVWNYKLTGKYYAKGKSY